MAAISKLLASSLDELADAIALAEDELGELVCSNGDSVQIGESEYPEDKVCLEFVTVEDIDRLCRVEYRAIDNFEFSRVDCKPLMEVCVSDRLEAASRIPELIRIVSDLQKDELPQKVRGITASIQEALAQL